MRLGFAVAAHLDADVLLLDEVFAVGDEEFQRKCFGKIFEFKQRGGTIVFVSHDAPPVERLCERAVLLRDGMVDFDGPTHEAIVRYRAQLAADARSGRARRRADASGGAARRAIAEVATQGAEGEERQQFLAGEPLTVRLRVACRAGDRAAAAPARAARRGGRCSPAASHDTAALGWDGAGAQVLRFDVDGLPLADGRFHLRFGLAVGDGGSCCHWLDDALGFLVIPAGEERGGARPARRALDEGGDRRARRTPLPMSSPHLPRLADV